MGAKSLATTVTAAITDATKQATQMFTLLPHPTTKEHYLLIKRRPDSIAAVYALALDIDAQQVTTHP